MKEKKVTGLKTLMHCIEEIPERLEDIIQLQDQIFAKLKDKLHNKKYKKITIIASGTSYNAAFTSKNFGQKVLQKDIELIYPSTFVNDYPGNMIDIDYLYIFISQTGTTKMVWDAMKIVNQKGADTISITEKLDVPIAKEAKLALEMGSKDEAFIYRTIGYSASVTTLIQLYLFLAKEEERITATEIEEYNQDFQVVIKNLPKIQKETLQWYEKNSSLLDKKTNFLFAGEGDLWSVAIEADIKFMEMLPVLSNNFELEELIHGPQNMFQEDYGVFLLVKDEIEKEKVQNIAQFIQNEVGNASVIVTNTKAETPYLKITSESKWFYALEYITVFQILAYKLGLDKGRDFTKGVYPQVTKYIQKSLK